MDKLFSKFAPQIMDHEKVLILLMNFKMCQYDTSNYVFISILIPFHFQIYHSNPELKLSEKT